METREKNASPHREIWLLVDSLLYGGIESHVLELSTALAQYQLNVRVVLLKQYSAPQLIINKLKQRGIAFNFLSQLSQRNELSPFHQLRSAIKKHQPLLIHAHGYKASIFSKLIRLSGVSLNQVTTFHAGEAPTGKVAFYDWLDRYSSPLSSCSFAVSPLIAKKVLGPTLVLNNFVSIPPASIPLRTGQNIAFVGRLSKEKAPDRFTALAAHFPDSNFVLYGAGPMEDELKKTAPNNVTFKGHISDMDTVWSEVDILLIPSRFEGLPMAALEAMARKIPIIATNVGALPDLIDSGKNGWISSSKSEMILALNQWCQADNTLKTKIRNAALSTIEKRFSIQAVLPIIVTQYNLIQTEYNLSL